CVSSSATNAVCLNMDGHYYSGSVVVGQVTYVIASTPAARCGYVLTLCAARDTSQVDGHPGYDWRMPKGTPLLAVADAVVMTAGPEAPNFCPQLNRTVQALL